jgi:hypothetical protein
MRGVILKRKEIFRENYQNAFAILIFTQEKVQF